MVPSLLSNIAKRSSGDLLSSSREFLFQERKEAPRRVGSFKGTDFSLLGSPHSDDLTHGLDIAEDVIERHRIVTRIATRVGARQDRKTENSSSGTSFDAASAKAAA